MENASWVMVLVPVLCNNTLNHISSVSAGETPLSDGWFQPTFRTLALNVWGLPRQDHNSDNIRHRPLALLPVHLINIIYFIIILCTLFTLITFDITWFPDYWTISSDKYTTTLYYLPNTSALDKSKRQTESLHLSPQKTTTCPTTISHNNHTRLLL